jgi:hypothetical protein
MADELLDKLSEYESEEEKRRIEQAAQDAWEAHQNAQKRRRSVPPDAQTEDAEVYEQ